MGAWCDPHFVFVRHRRVNSGGGYCGDCLIGDEFSPGVKCCVLVFPHVFGASGTCHAVFGGPCLCFVVVKKKEIINKRVSWNTIVTEPDRVSFIDRTHTHTH